MAFQLCANIGFLFPEHPFLDRFDRAAEAGFKGVECPFPYDHPPAIVAERLRSAGVKQVLFNTSAGDWDAGERGLAVDPARKAEFQDSIARAVEYATALDCPKVHVMAGIPPSDISRETAHGIFVENVAYAAEVFARAGITALIEPINDRVDMPGYFLTTSEHAMRVIAEVEAPNLRLQYDIYHMHIMEGVDPARIAELLPVIGHMQLADHPGRNEPGTGEIAFDTLLPALEEMGYDGWMGCEYRPQVGLGWASRWLQSDTSGAS